MPEDTEVADILFVRAGARGNTLANIGEQSSGDGFGADTAVWGNGDGFISVPNPPDSNGCAQAMVQQDGNVKRIVATVDNRYVEAAGPLALGDNAIVTNGTTYFKHTQADDTIKIAGADKEIKVDGINNRIQLRLGTMTVVLDGVDGTMTFTLGPNVITMSNAEIALVSRAVPGGPVAAISLLPSGTMTIATTLGLAIVGPATVNGIPIP